MRTANEQGQVHPSAMLLVVVVIVAGVWVWKRLPPDTQGYLIDQALPMAAGAGVIGLIVLAVLRNIRRRAARRRQRDRLIAAFRRETDPGKRLDLSFALVECNAYRAEGLETVAADLLSLWDTTLRQAQGDDRHRIRGMAASHLGVLQNTAVVPLLLNALEDDHPYVRACAALGLGRLRASEATSKLEHMANEDWDQSVRSRCREALDQMRHTPS
jgi:hypothetical protein